ncbi:efflux RND transporter periplasmic adaptor subunit [Helicobacter sp. 11S03491-1]|uniref:efflux RND transporter periplasmic adaptor subunit n=1 Tax=Helicobacter sp. 11S03491-1 TaxID=1476196 RepID=UPI000BA72F6B|nr:efflux RND transporter periplasmic adaptor subunit [Helicobacter sp. 11S03491-1]PAF42231.1 efflux transporter periplasmic adaptor subunit [Helicobacter sp. 11S03491-1]
MQTDKILRTINPKKSNKKWYFILIGFVFFISISGGGYFYFHHEDKISYTIANPYMGDITQTISATGTLSPTDEVEIGSQVSGTIQEVFVDVNDSVTKGQILAKINPEKIHQALDKYKAQINSAKATLFACEVVFEQKKWNYEHLEKLYKATNAKTPSELDLQNAKMEYLQAKADVQIKQAAIEQIIADMKLSEIDLKNSIITSPINGIVLTRSVDPGQTVVASFQTPTLFKLAQNLEEMNLIVNVSESDIGKLKNGQKVTFHVDAYPDIEFEARVDRVSFASSDNTDTTNNIVSYETKIYVDNKNLLLRSGMSVTANIQVAQAYQTLLIPVSALFYAPQKNITKKNKQSSASFMGTPKKKATINDAKEIKNKMAKIWILQDNVPKELMVSVGISDGKSAQVISSDLNTHTQVITSSVLK